MIKTVQEAFRKFHRTIKLNIEDNRKLAEKRDMLIDEIHSHLKKLKEETGVKLTLTVKNQGSYAMRTGIEPLEGDDYDIDVMLLFAIDKDEFEAKEIKKIVFDALNRHPRTTTIKKPCVRVQYHQNGEVKFHVDFAVYAKNEDDVFLSKKPNYASEDEIWESSEPEELKKLIDGYHKDPEVRAQFRRVIRYLKRWKDLKFRSNSNGKPTGIALTAIALEGFESEVEYDSLSNKYKVDDLQATINLVEYFISLFSWWSNNINVSLPIKPYNDLFEKMSKNQKTKLKEKLELLKEDLITAQNEADPHKASKKLRQQQVFGADFPEIPKDDSGQHRPKAIITPPDQA